MGKKLLGKYEIQGGTGWDTPNGDFDEIYLKNGLEGEDRFSVSKIKSPNQISISSNTQLNKLDETFVPHLELMKRVYLDLLEFSKKTGFESRMYSKRVIRPRFKVRMLHEGIINPAYNEESSHIYHEAYTSIIKQFGGQAVVAPDFIHEEQALISLSNGISIELPKMNEDSGFIPFTIVADEHADYSILPNVSGQLEKVVKQAFGENLKMFNYEVTQAYFRFDVDLDRSALPAPFLAGFLE